MSNADPKTIKSFGDEWSRYNQEKLLHEEHQALFESYFHIFPWKSIGKFAKGFDMGCGSGRWAMLVAPKVDHLTCIDPSPEALDVARKNLKNFRNIDFLNSGTSESPLPPDSQDFGYCLGVLHHIPNTFDALKDCIKMLKPGAPFLIYLYYNFDNRSKWYVIIWKISNVLRLIISKMPSSIKAFITNVIAIFIYFPLSRFSLFGEKIGFNVDNWLLSSYRKASFYTMRTDSRDRFGTPLERRFTQVEIKKMMMSAGLKDIEFSDRAPFWCAVGIKA